jgi:hypothetical protein
MASRDLRSNLGIVQLLDPADQAHTTFKSSVLDTRGFEGVLVEVTLGAFTGADVSNYLTPKMQESDTTNDADFTDVAAGDLQGSFTVVNDTTTKDSQTQVVGYVGSKRYIRVVGTYTGTGITASLVGVTGVLGVPHIAPAVAPAAITAT